MHMPLCVLLHVDGVDGGGVDSTGEGGEGGGVFDGGCVFPVMQH